MIDFIKKNFELKKILKSFIVIYLFFYRSVFNIIPMLIFDLDFTNISNKTLGYLNLYMGVVFLIIVLLIYFKDIINEFKIFIKKFWSNFDTGFKYWILGLGIMYISNLIFILVFKSGGANNENAVQEIIKACPIGMGFYTCLVAPFVEEIVFRKTLKDVFKNKWFFVVLSFLFFGGAHVLSMAESFVDFLYIIPYGALGATFAYAYHKTDTVFTTITFHMIHNTALFFLSILM